LTPSPAGRRGLVAT